MAKKDTRTREEKLRDLAANTGATDAEKNAALFFLENSTVKSGIKSGTTNSIHVDKPDERMRRKAADQRSQYETARRIQLHINEEIRRRNAPLYTPPQAAQTPVSPPGQPDYSPFLLFTLFIIFSLYYGC